MTLETGTGSKAALRARTILTGLDLFSKRPTGRIRFNECSIPSAGFGGPTIFCILIAAHALKSRSSESQTSLYSFRSALVARSQEFRLAGPKLSLRYVSGAAYGLALSVSST